MMSLSNSPSSSYSDCGPEAWLRYYCAECDHEYEVRAIYDMGTWDIEGDTRCPLCKRKGEMCLAG